MRFRPGPSACWPASPGPASSCCRYCRAWGGSPSREKLFSGPDSFRQKRSTEALFESADGGVVVERLTRVVQLFNRRTVLRLRRRLGRCFDEINFDAQGLAEMFR